MEPKYEHIYSVISLKLNTPNLNEKINYQRTVP